MDLIMAMRKRKQSHVFSAFYRPFLLPILPVLRIMLVVCVKYSCLSLVDSSTIPTTYDRFIPLNELSDFCFSRIGFVCLITDFTSVVWRLKNDNLNSIDFLADESN